MSFTTLIPAYKSEFLIPLLTCLRRQSLKSERIIFSDDSPKNAFIQILNSEPIKSKVADLRIHVLEGPKKGADENIKHLLKYYLEGDSKPTKQFHILLDDDLIYPTFYSQHKKGHENYKTKCVLSRRWLTIEDSDPAKDAYLPTEVEACPETYQSLPIDQLFGLTVGKGINWLGEFSNATFARDMASQFDQPTFQKIPYTGLDDLGAFLRSARDLPVIFINQHLGIFRKSPRNNSSNPEGEPFKQALLAWFALAIIGRQLGYLTDEQYLYSIAHRKANLLDHYERSYKNHPNMQHMLEIIFSTQPLTENFRKSFLLNWRKFLVNG